MDKLHKAAGAVATLADLAAISIKYTVAKISHRSGRRFYQQQLVKPDTQMAVCQLLYLLSCQKYRLVDCIDNNKVVTEAVHLGELEFHGKTITVKLRQVACLCPEWYVFGILWPGVFVSRINRVGISVLTSKVPEDAVMAVADLGLEALAALLSVYGLACELVREGVEIPGSYWGEREAGLIGNRLIVRADTPVHSALHEACHYICMSPARRNGLHTDAGGDYDEENAVCYLQILLAGELPTVGRQKLMRDMDAWGYTFRLGSAAVWFAEDAGDTRAWLRDFGLIDNADRPAWQLRVEERPAAGVKPDL